MKRAVILKHAEFEGPARIAELLAAQGYLVDVRELQRGDAVPVELPADDLLVVMGGPMGVADVDKPRYPFLRPELELLRQRIARDQPVLGICLGAQLLAAAAGARVFELTAADGSRAYEVGWAPVRLHHQPGADPILSEIPERAHMLHWHGDTFELPAGARRLASSDLCPNQAFQLGTRVFALQFHCEVAPEHIERLLRADREFAECAHGASAAERIRLDTQTHYPHAREVGDRFLRNILAAMSAA